MFHHHPIQHEDSNLGSEDLMKNGSRLIDTLEKYGYCLVIHGHKHHPRIRYASGGSNSLPVFASGSLSGSNNKAILTITRNLFHVIDFPEGSCSKKGVVGIIRSWEFNMGMGWRIATRSSADFPGKTGFGCRENISTLVCKISKYYQRNKKRQKCLWHTVTKQFPIIEYLIPGDFQQLEKALKKDYRIRILYDERLSPIEIGEIPRK